MGTTGCNQDHEKARRIDSNSPEIDCQLTLGVYGAKREVIFRARYCCIPLIDGAEMSRDTIELVVEAAIRVLLIVLATDPRP